MGIAWQRAFERSAPTGAVRAPHNGPSEQRSRRGRTQWELMLWTFVVFQGREGDGWLLSRAHAAGSEGEEEGAGATPAASEAVRVPSDQVDLAAGAEGEAETEGEAPVEAQKAGVDSGTQGAGSGQPAAAASKAVGSSTSISVLQGNSAALGADGGGGGGGGFVGPIVIGSGFTGFPPPIVPVSPFAEFDPMQFSEETLTFFDGLQRFVEDLRTEAGIEDLLAATPIEAQGVVGNALAFSENVLLPVGFWQAGGPLAEKEYFTTADVFDVDWSVQLNGVVDGKSISAADYTGFENSEFDATADISGKSFGNSARAVDGQDWQGTLWVEGDYHEFNTIVQVNLLWDNDQIALHSGGAAGAGSGASGAVVRSGENQQANTALISALPGEGEQADGPSWSNPNRLVIGGATTHNKVVQVNVIVDTDRIDFNLDAILGDTLGSLDFASVYSAGHVQENESTIVTRPSTFAVDQSWRSFLDDHDDGFFNYVIGDYLEINTVMQVNATFDRDIVDRTSASESQALATWQAEAAEHDAAGREIISSGGSLQFNTASLLKNDHSDVLFVGGRYTEYNLVLQINVMDDSDVIEQIIGRGRGNEAEQDVADQGSDGHGGEHGEGSSQLAMPSVNDDPMARSADFV